MKRLVLVVTLGCLYFCGVNAIGQIYCDEKGTCFLNPDYLDPEWLKKPMHMPVPETPRTMYIIESTPEPTPKSDDLCYDDGCFKGSGWWWDKDGLFHYKSEKGRKGWEVKIGNSGFEFGMHWRR